MQLTAEKLKEKEALKAELLGMVERYSSVGLMSGLLTTLCLLISENVPIEGREGLYNLIRKNVDLVDKKEAVF